MELLSHPAVIAAFVGGAFTLIAALIVTSKGGSFLEYLRARKVTRLKADLQGVCPHVEYDVVTDDDGASHRAIRPCCHSPQNTPLWFCFRCNGQFYGEHFDRILERWTPLTKENQSEVTALISKADKLRGKLDRLSDDWARRS